MLRLLLALCLATVVLPAVEVQLVFDDKADEEKLKAFGARSRELIQEWEPKVAAVLGTAEAKRPKQLTVRFKDMDGVAYWDGKAITVSTRYAAKHPDDVMLVVHELTHVLQGYRKIPGWMTEGLADYVRFGIAEGGKFGIRLDPVKNKPRDSYRVTGYLILQAEKAHPGLVKKLHLAGVSGGDVEKVWAEHCGQTIDESWAEAVPAKTK
ncbi:MAG: hypothetical protein RIR91_976 [Verrucomicrobiota bacterium]|jgi:hypothetical protein